MAYAGMPQVRRAQSAESDDDIAPDDNVAVVIVNYRTPELTLANVAALALERRSIPDLRVIVVDGGSADGSADRLRAGLSGYDWVDLLALDFNGGFGWANNQAILHLLQGDAPPSFIHLLNPDAVIIPDAVVMLRAALCAHPTCAAAGSQLLDGNGAPSGSAFRFPTVAREFFRGAQMTRAGRALGVADLVVHATSATPVDWVTGASVMLRAAALRQAGLFDTGFFLYYEEVELMHRLKTAGWDIWFIPDSRVVHIEGAATGMSGAPARIPDYMFASRRRFFVRAYGAGWGRGATLAWLAGNLMLRIVKIFGVFGDRASADAERAGLLRHGIGASRRDTTPAVTAWTDAPGALPAWHMPG